MTDEPEAEDGQDAEPTGSDEAATSGAQPGETSSGGTGKAATSGAQPGETSSGGTGKAATSGAQPGETSSGGTDKATTSGETPEPAGSGKKRESAESDSPSKATASTESDEPSKTEKSTGSETSSKRETSASRTSDATAAAAAEAPKSTSSAPKSTSSAPKSTSSASKSTSSASKSKPDASKSTSKRRWWQRQRWIVPIALVVLVLAAFGVGALVAAERNDTFAPAAGLDSEPASSQPATVPVSEPPPPQQQQDQDNDQEQQQDQRTAQVCQRIIALQQNIVDGGIEPLDAFNEVTAIEREARGTELAVQVNNAGAVVQQVIFGQATLDDVYASIQGLATTCAQ